MRIAKRVLAMTLLLSSLASLATAQVSETSTGSTTQTSTSQADSGSTAKDYGNTYPMNCRAGCLVCSYKDICLLCNLANFFLQHGYTCKRKLIENCEMTNDGVLCLFCKAGFFLGGFGFCEGNLGGKGYSIMGCIVIEDWGSFLNGVKVWILNVFL